MCCLRSFLLDHLVLESKVSLIGNFLLVSSSTSPLQWGRWGGNVDDGIHMCLNLLFFFSLLFVTCFRFMYTLPFFLFLFCLTGWNTWVGKGKKMTRSPPLAAGRLSEQSNICMGRISRVSFTTVCMDRILFNASQSLFSIAGYFWSLPSRSCFDTAFVLHVPDARPPS